MTGDAGEGGVMAGRRSVLPTFADVAWPWCLTNDDDEFREIEAEGPRAPTPGQAVDTLERCVDWLTGPGRDAPGRAGDPPWLSGTRWFEPFDAVCEAAPRIGDVTVGDLRTALSEYARSQGIDGPVPEPVVAAFVRNWPRERIQRLVERVTWWIARLDGALAGTAELARLEELTLRYLTSVPEDRERPGQLVTAIEAAAHRGAIDFLRGLAVNPDVSERARADARHALTWIASGIAEERW